MQQQKQIEILKNLSLNKELLSYSEIYKIEEINDSCFIIYLYCSSFVSSQHIFVFTDDESDLKKANFHINKHLSLQRDIKSRSFYLCVQGSTHNITLSEEKGVKQYRIEQPKDLKAIKIELLECKVNSFPDEKTSLTYLLMALIIAVYLLSFLSLEFGVLTPWFSQIGISLLNYIENDLYNMGMALIQHSGLTHLGVNLLSLIYIGRHLERHFSSIKYVVVILLSAICGALGSVAFIPLNSISVGASGFIMGLFGALLIVNYFGNKKWSGFYRDQAIKLRRSLLVLLGVNLLIPLFISNIDSSAHICGFVGGSLTSYLFTAKKKYKTKLVLCVVLFMFIFILEYRIEHKIEKLLEFEHIQRELISSLNTKEYIMKRNILKISNLNKGIKFEFRDINGVTYPIEQKLAAKDPLLQQLNRQLTTHLNTALNQNDVEDALIKWELECKDIELKVLLKYKLIKADATRNTK